MKLGNTDIHFSSYMITKLRAHITMVKWCKQKYFKYSKGKYTFEVEIKGSKKVSITLKIWFWYLLPTLSQQ